MNLGFLENLSSIIVGEIWPNMDVEQFQNEENNSCGDSDIHFCIYDDGKGLEICV